MLLQDGSNQSPGVAHGFGGMGPGLGVNEGLPADGDHGSMHGWLKIVSGDGAIAFDGGGGQHAIAGADIVLDGLRQGGGVGDRER